MGSYLSPEIYIPILVFGVGILFYYFYRKVGDMYPKKKRDGTKEADGPETKTPPMPLGESVYAQVFDNTGIVPMWYWDTIPGNVVSRIMQDHETLGIQQDTDDGKKAYQLVKDKTDKVQSYSPVKYPILKDDDPVSLNYDTEHPEYEVILQEMLSEEKNFMQKYGQVLWWAAVIGFIIFMMVSG